MHITDALVKIIIENHHGFDIDFSDARTAQIISYKHIVLLHLTNQVLKISIIRRRSTTGLSVLLINLGDPNSITKITNFINTQLND